MTLYFAYGSNMSVVDMRARCFGATALGAATLPHWRFVINPDGYGSVEPRANGVVHGVLWRVTPRDLAALNAYENIGGGLYRCRILPVRLGGCLAAALVYVACRRGSGTPRPGYIDLVVAAAREWQFPERYIGLLRRWAPSAWCGVRPRDTGELG
jgi:Gamma-glutamyl cyclotransferase, AIG2-like